MRKLLLVLVVAAMVAVMTVSVVPTLAQTDGTDESKFVAQTEEEKKKEKDKEKKEKDKEKKEKDKEKKDKAKEEEKEITAVPSSGGISLDGAALLGLGAGALIVGGGLVTLRIVRAQ